MIDSPEKQKQRADDWAWANFFVHFLEYEAHTYLDFRNGRELHLHLTAKKRGLTTKGIES